MSSILFNSVSTQLVNSVQSACRPHFQPVEYLEKSQFSFLLGRKHKQRLRLLWHPHGLFKSRSLTKCLPNKVPPLKNLENIIISYKTKTFSWSSCYLPVFWMCKKTITSWALISNWKDSFEKILSYPETPWILCKRKAGWIGKRLVFCNSKELYSKSRSKNLKVP